MVKKGLEILSKKFGKIFPLKEWKMVNFKLCETNVKMK